MATMSAITASELDLLTFFEVDPFRLDANVPWIYNSLTYKVNQDEWSLSFEIAPSYKSVKIDLMYSGRLVYGFQGAPEDINYVKKGKSESLEIRLSKTASLLIFLKANIVIHHRQDLDDV
jgi:hypothetical protein